MPTLCRHCGDTLPAHVPADVTSCGGYSQWLARQCGGALTENEAGTLMLLAHFCELSVAIRDELELLSELE
jgi:hypothetical protein